MAENEHEFTRFADTLAALIDPDPAPVPPVAADAFALAARILERA